MHFHEARVRKALALRRDHAGEFDDPADQHDGDQRENSGASKRDPSRRNDDPARDAEMQRKRQHRADQSQRGFDRRPAERQSRQCEARRAVATPEFNADNGDGESGESGHQPGGAPDLRLRDEQQRPMVGEERRSGDPGQTHAENSGVKDASRALRKAGCDCQGCGLRRAGDKRVERPLARKKIGVALAQQGQPFVVDHDEQPVRQRQAQSDGKAQRGDADRCEP